MSKTFKDSGYGVKSYQNQKKDKKKVKTFFESQNMSFELDDKPKKFVKKQR